MMPGLLPASIPSPPPQFAQFHIGPLTIHAYALCILAGIVVAMWMTSRRWNRRGAPAEAVWDICIWAIPFGIVGGRLYHVLITDPEYYFGLNGMQAHWSEIPQIWAGGLGIMGAVSLGALGAWIGCRRAGVRLSAFADAAAPGVLLAQAFGRWGNWFNQELFGTPTTLPWGLQIDYTSHNFPPGLPPGTLFQPTFLYESLWNLAGVGLLLLLDRKFKLHRGSMFWSYVIWYGIGRTLMETMRIDPAEIINILGIGLRVHMWLAIGLVIMGLIGLLYVLIRLRPQPDPGIYLPGRAPVEEKVEAGSVKTATEADADSTGGAPDPKDTPDDGPDVPEPDAK
ncbi:prolipoprotein diacylglyceryl transferase [Paeniglutamicibacter cryotolerans]|uniref:Phosphatidylglycerol--prolipoprotein diacylglyceryl transferase n=1 Tax=Paeniglutamicibacter cryotolerans TaxID=670079 RepID=A0A839QKN7_9MICC|nr:prolipoprotein diacylglyceryl transferase [Paeniglutamicibacter cryotolerans]MBB2996769.1 prolipoprotein diacylglyceryl transferase [Paeniglutamicibacter cryotolerans]